MAHTGISDGENSPRGAQDWLAALLLFCLSATGYAQTLPAHQLRVSINPEQHSLTVRDRITLPADTPRTLDFVLHRDLNPGSPDASLAKLGDEHAPWLQRYRATLPPGQTAFTLTYAGTLFHPPQQDAREARTQESTPGIIAPEGVVLAGDSGWYPVFGEGMLTFALDIGLPPGWEAVSQGERGGAEGAPPESGNRVLWEERQPQKEIFLIAAPFRKFARTEEGIDVLAYLRSADEALAKRYLDATGGYLALYQRLIGPYPYGKFALVENFWETGYGMPSFTLLGSQVIRLPFIIDTSYPHEILHNWWGNGVYVDYASGNWSEGLTAYLADHLFQEEKGAGADYRRGMLQKYTDFVSSGSDFPLADFRSRHSAQTEAVGYGKAMMLFHMLRCNMGDEKFTRALQKFYGDYRFRTAGYADIERYFSRESGADLKPYFAQWVRQSGAPQLHPVAAQAKRVAAGYELDIVVEQTQPGPAYELSVPLAVTLAGQADAYQTVMAVKDRRAELHLQFAAQPLRVDIDPEFDLFRRLDRAEIPPAFSQVFGAEKLLIVLPRNATEALRERYADIARAWQTQPSRVTTVKWDDEIGQLPDTGAVWLFGWENGYRNEFSAALKNRGAALSDTGVQIGGNTYDRGRHALAMAARIGATPAAWLAAADAGALPGLARKLPHYSKYSYAVFASPELGNLSKGMWAVTDSPMGMPVRLENGTVVAAPMGNLAARAGLSKPGLH